MGAVNLRGWQRYSLVLSALCLAAVVAEATVSIEGYFYNSDYGMSFDEEGQNAAWKGDITLLPTEGFMGQPSSILSLGAGGPVKGDVTKYTSQMSLSGHGTTAITGSLLQEDPEVKPVLKVEWGHVIAAGNPQNIGECSINNYITIMSIPGYLTYPTAEVIPSISAGLTFEANTADGQQLKTYCPPLEFGDFPATFSVMKSKYDDVYMKNSFNIYASWQ